MTRDKRVVARDLLLKADIRPSSVFGLEGEHFLLHQDNVIALVRATLKEAARAVCEDCERHARQGKSACSRVFRSDAELPLKWAHYNDGAQWPCEAGPIHDLIAALEEEADDAR